MDICWEINVQWTRYNRMDRDRENMVSTTYAAYKVPLPLAWPVYGVHAIAATYKGYDRINYTFTWQYTIEHFSHNDALFIVTLCENYDKEYISDLAVWCLGS